MQVRFICPWCGGVEQITNDGLDDKHCVWTYCKCRRRSIRVVFNTLACLSCKVSHECQVPKVVPLPGKTLKQLRKQK